VTPHRLQSLRERIDRDVPYGQGLGTPRDPRPELDPGLFGTVGAVALDRAGNLAAATSTGGREGKLPGRVGDSPIVGAGTYANNATLAISSTGLGEFVMRRVTAYDVSAMIEYKGLTLDEAVETARQKVTDLGGSNSLIALNRKGEMSIRYAGDGMYRGYVRADGKPVVTIYRD
jgi:beta-aspartyl-peptidase (threonine type)